MRMFRSGFGLLLDLDRVLFIAEPGFVDNMGHGGFFIEMSICFQLSTICTSIADATVTQRCKIASCSVPGASRGTVAVRLQDGAPRQPNELECIAYTTVGCRGVMPQDVTPSVLRHLSGDYGHRVHDFFKNYDELVAAWSNEPQYCKPPIDLFGTALPAPSATVGTPAKPVEPSSIC